MTEHTPNETDAQHAERIRAAQVEFNAAIDAAHEVGINVSYSLIGWAGRTGKCDMINLKMMRRFSWDNDEGDIEL